MKTRRTLPFVFLVAGTLAACTKATTPLPPKPPAVTPPPKPQPVDPRYTALPTPGPRPAWGPPKISQFELKNGIRVWHVEQAQVPLVAVHLVLPVGAASDPVGKEGLTSLAVDLLDEGAGKKSTVELSDALGRLATDYQTQLGYDHVLLSVNALEENLEPSLALLSDIIRRPNLEKGEFDRVREQHVAAAGQRTANPNQKLSETIASVLFGNGYAGTPLDGTSESLGKISLADLKAQAKMLGQAEGAEIVIVGQITKAEASAALTKAFGDWKGKRTFQERPVEIGPKERKAYLVPFPGSSQSALAVVRRAGSSSDPNYFPELVYNRQIGEAFTSRINLNLREAKGYTYGAFSMFRRYLKAGYFGVVANVKSEVTRESLVEIEKELSSVCADRPFSAEEHALAREGLLEGYPMRFEMMEEVGMQMATLPIYDRPLDYFTSWPERVRAVTPAEVLSAARPFCDKDAYQIIIAGDENTVRPALESHGLKVEVLARTKAASETPPSGEKK